MGRRPRNPDNCPICGEYMSVLCSGHRDKPFIDGKKYNDICFACFHVPKVWTCKLGRPRDGSADVWEGPFWDAKHLCSAQELVADGVCDITQARKSARAVKSLVKNVK